MPITWLLHEDYHSFGSVKIKVLTAASEDALRALQLGRIVLTPQSNTIAKRIIDLRALASATQFAFGNVC